MQLQELVDTSHAVGATRSRRDKVAHLAGVLRRLSPAEVPIAVDYLAGELPQGRIGVGFAMAHRVVAPPASAASLTLVEVDATLQRIADTQGSGSQTDKEQLLGGLLARASADEQSFLRGLLLRELRQGALEGLMVEAIAVAASLPVAEVRRAVMLAGDVAAVAAAALAEGQDGLRRFRLTLLRPVQPMLAQTAAGVDDALERFGETAVEYKLDGARLQVHRAGEDVRIYTRSLRDVTVDLPDIATLVRRLPVENLILDGEALGVDDRGRPLRFQDTMRHFGGGNGDQLPRGRLLPYFFDVLHLDGDDLIDRPGRDRIAAMADVLPAELLVPRRLGVDAEAATGVLRDALLFGHEGVMLKDLDAPYEAGRRGAAWLKVKPAHTLDLVVLAAEWGSGRRRGWLSNLHLGARDPDRGGFVMLGKTFKGLTDGLLTWQTEQLLAREIGRDRHIVHVRPELVVEIAFDGVQTSPRYPAGLALRFARVKRYRPDKPAGEADTIDVVRAIHAGERLPAV